LTYKRTIKTSCKFHSLKHFPHYKQSIYFNRAPKTACFDIGWPVTSQGQIYLHMTASRARHRWIVKLHQNIGSAHWRSVAFVLSCTFHWQIIFL